MRFKSLFFSVLLLQLSACDNFRYSIYSTEINVPETNIIAKNIDEMTATPEAYSPFSIRVFSDIQAFYSDLVDVSDYMQQQNDYDFYFVLGDLTESGLAQEYEWAMEYLSDIEKPLFPAVGNHDVLNNGKAIYQKIFGSFDYSFTYKEVAFISLNTNNWEFGNSVPNIPWLEQQLQAAQGSKYIIVLSHAPICCERFKGEEQERLSQLMADYNVDLVLGGHQHSQYNFGDLFGDGVQYFNVASIDKRLMIKVTFLDDEILIEDKAF